MLQNFASWELRTKMIGIFSVIKTRSIQLELAQIELPNKGFGKLPEETRQYTQSIV